MMALTLAVSCVVGVDSAAAVPKDACPVLGAAEAGATLSVQVPAGLVLVGPAAVRVSASIAGATSNATYVVEYGLSPAYGLCTPVSPVAAAAGQGNTEVLLTGLMPETTYHFVVVVNDGSATASTGDLTLTTLAAGLIPQGATINGVAVGGIGETDALRVLRRQAAPVRLTFAGRTWSTSRATLGAGVDASRMSRALQALPGQALSVPMSIDIRRLADYLATANRRYGHPAQRAIVRLLGRHAVVSPARPAIQIATRRAQTAIAAYLTQGRSGLLRLARRAAPATHAPREKTVVVRLTTQTLTAYLDGAPVLTTPVTTGRPALPTPIGSFYIHSRSSPYVFTSPWPKGNPFWYPPTPATWAMYFYDNDFLHDDPVEPTSAFGAGSQNGPYASHGCIHVPHDAMAFLYRWLPIGATVIVAQN
jgi:lipoprotein-anchoring transpeptidase ErfK/SrfK